MKGTVTRLYTPDNPALLPAICGPQHRNLMKLEMALIDGKLRADSQGGSIRLNGSQGAVADAEAALAAFERMLRSDPAAGEDAFEGAIDREVIITARCVTIVIPGDGLILVSRGHIPCLLVDLLDADLAFGRSRARARGFVVLSERGRADEQRHEQEAQREEVSRKFLKMHDRGAPMRKGMWLSSHPFQRSF